VTAINEYAGAGSKVRQSDLFGTKGASGLLKQMTGGLKGVDNIYTQHTPLLSQTLENLAKVRQWSKT
jgi:vacuolar protein sorting-associated protein 45